MTIKTALKYSLGLHAVLLFLMAGSPTGCGKGNGGDKGDGGKGSPKEKHHIVAKKDTIDINLVDVPKEGITKNKKQKAKERDCGKGGWFGGVGLTEAAAVVSEVYAGYPAAKAGLQKGDYLLNAGTLKGPPGSRVWIDYLRDGKRFSVLTFREKICVSDGDAP